MEDAVRDALRDAVKNEDQRAEGLAQESPVDLAGADFISTLPKSVVHRLARPRSRNVLDPEADFSQPMAEDILDQARVPTQQSSFLPAEVADRELTLHVDCRA
jgi:hypothetical protein